MAQLRRLTGNFKPKAIQIIGKKVNNVSGVYGLWVCFDKDAERLGLHAARG